MGRRCEQTLHQEMAQTMYTHMNKWIKKKKNIGIDW
jgi:hypothetical protein